MAIPIQRKPWPIYSTHAHCSGPCDQGHRLCMTPEACQTGQHAADDDGPPREPMTALDVVLMLLAYGACAFVVYLAALGAWPYVSAMASAIKRGWLS